MVCSLLFSVAFLSTYPPSLRKARSAYTPQGGTEKIPESRFLKDLLDAGFRRHDDNCVSGTAVNLALLIY